MRIGLQVTNFTWPNQQGSLGETFGLIAQRAEAEAHPVIYFC